MSATPEIQTTNKTLKPIVGVSGRTIVYDKDGKPCRACNTLLDFQMATGKKPKSDQINQTSLVNKAIEKDEYRQDPPDVEVLGKSSWTFMHSLCAKYPENPSPKDKNQISTFFDMLGRMYPCDWCAEDFSQYLKDNKVDTSSNDGLNMWLCGAHNAVNVKLGKKEFDCQLWKKRWRDGWE
ncbi:hypothetical protein QEN19_003838 [Hanseniaspora menglaensis]